MSNSLIQLPLFQQSPEETSPFDRIRHVDADGEYWLARELMPLLEYVKWQKFTSAIRKASHSITANKQKISDHVLTASDKHVTKQGAVREISDFRLSRYACYLVAMNSDTRKEAVAKA